MQSYQSGFCFKCNAVGTTENANNWFFASKYFNACSSHILTDLSIIGVLGFFTQSGVVNLVSVTRFKNLKIRNINNT